MEDQKKVELIIQLVGVMNSAKAQILELLKGSNTRFEVTGRDVECPPPKRKYKKRKNPEEVIHREAPKENAEMPKKKHSRFAVRPCCGSAGPRHKRGCDGKAKRDLSPVSDEIFNEPEEDDLDGSGKVKNARCVTCDHEFHTDKPLFEEVCPQCDSQAIVENE